MNALRRWSRRRARGGRGRTMALASLEAAVVAPTFACTEFWLVPMCVVRLGAGVGTIAALACLPLIAVAVLGPLVAPWTRSAGASHRVLWSFSALQAVLLGLLVVPVHNPEAPWALATAVALVVGVALSGACAGTAWLALMASVVPPRIQGRYTTGRLRMFLGVKLLTALAFAVIFERLPLVAGPWGFDLVLAIAVVARLGSAAINSRLIATSRPIPSDAPLTARIARRPAGLGAMLTSPFGRWTMAWAALHFGVAIAGPYFVPYMLAPGPAGLALAGSPLAYALLMQTSQVIRLLCLPVVGRLIDRLGALGVLRMALAGITLVPAIWALTTSFPLLIAAEILGGAVWCAAECAVAVLLMDPAIPNRQRGLLIAMHQTATSLAVVGGALVGGALLGLVPGLDGSNYRMLFLISLLCRVPAMAVALLLLPRLGRSLRGTAREVWGAVVGAVGAGTIGRGLGRFLRRPEG